MFASLLHCSYISIIDDAPSVLCSHFVPWNYHFIHHDIISIKKLCYEIVVYNEVLYFDNIFQNLTCNEYLMLVWMSVQACPLLIQCRLFYNGFAVKGTFLVNRTVSVLYAIVFVRCIETLFYLFSEEIVAFYLFSVKTLWHCLFNAFFFNN